MARKTAPTWPPAPARPLLGSVLERPDDDAARLVLADWLEEHGGESDRARAQLIRLQVEQARRGPYDAGHRGRQVEAEALLAVHGAEWAEVLPEWARERVEYERGFVRRVGLTVGRLASSLDKVRTVAPVEAVHVRRLGRQLARLDVPALEQLRELSLAQNPLRSEEVTAFARGLCLGRLEALDLSHTQLTTAGVVALANTGSLSRLRSLNVQSNELGPNGAFALDRPGMAGLTTLRIGDNRLGLAGVRALAGSSHLARLCSLDLCRTRLDRDGVAALVAAPFLPGLRELDLSKNHLDAEALAPLLGTSDFAPARLELRLNHLDGAGAVLVHAPFLASVRHLGLASASLDKNGIDWLLQLADRRLPSLHTLLLASNRLGPPLVKALLGGGRDCGFCDLTWLDLADNPIGNEGARTVAESPRLANLAGLDLGLCGINVEGLEALASSPNLANVVHLDLSNNPLGDRGLDALLASPHLGRLRQLDLRNTGLTSESARLADPANLPGLAQLNWWTNGLGEADEKALLARFGAVWWGG